jgi:hypothetical protein
MATVTIAIRLAHDGFGPIVFPFHKAITQTCRQEVKEGQNFGSPVTKSRQRFAQFSRPCLFDMRDLRIQLGRGCLSRSGGIPGAQVFFELPGHRNLRKRLG